MPTAYRLGANGANAAHLAARAVTKPPARGSLATRRRYTSPSNRPKISDIRLDPYVVTMRLGRTISTLVWLGPSGHLILKTAPSWELASWNASRTAPSSSARPATCSFFPHAVRRSAPAVISWWNRRSLGACVSPRRPLAPQEQDQASLVSSRPGGIPLLVRPRRPSRPGSPGSPPLPGRRPPMKRMRTPRRHTAGS